MSWQPGRRPVHAAFDLYDALVKVGEDPHRAQLVVRALAPYLVGPTHPPQVDRPYPSEVDRRPAPEAGVMPNLDLMLQRFEHRITIKVAAMIVVSWGLLLVVLRLMR
jgi:hypothetical protein